MIHSDECLTYTVEEAAKLLRIGRNQGYEAVASGAIPSVRIGKRILVPRAALETMLSNPTPTRSGARR